jgi:hypothetical protein
LSDSFLSGGGGGGGGNGGGGGISSFAARGLVCFDVEADAQGPLDARPRWGGAAAPSVVTCQLSGVYRVEVVFFCLAPPAITLLVNDAPAVSTTLPGGGSAPSGGAAAAGGRAAVALGEGASVASGALVLHRHEAGAVAGTSASVFVALPRGARLSVLLAGATKGQGILCVTKV